MVSNNSSSFKHLQTSLKLFNFVKLFTFKKVVNAFINVISCYSDSMAI